MGEVGVKYTFEVIGVVHSCYKEKFGIPRQPGLVSEARASIELLPPYNRSEAVKGLESFSHLWVIFVFHAIQRQEWRPTVRPPRLGGNTRLGVFATRSTHRPNPIGQSLVELERIEQNEGKVILHLRGIDLLDGTPVLDIKPYIPYAESIPDARGGFARSAPQESMQIEFSTQAQAECERRQAAHQLDLKLLITQILQQDPRPAYRKGEEGGAEYGMKLLDFNLRWRVEADNRVTVLSLD